MWFDARAALGEIRSEGYPRATPAIRAIPGEPDSTCRTNSTPPAVHAAASDRRPNSTHSTNSTAMAPRAEDPVYLADRFEELAAILEYDEGLTRAGAERRARLIVYGGQA